MKSNDLKINEQLKLAIESHKNKKFQLAEKLYKLILLSNEDHLEANFQLGTLYSQLQNFQLAKPLLTKAHKLSPKNPNINLHIGNLFLSTGDPLEALNYFEKVIEVKPNFALAHFNKGITLYNQKKYPDAVRCLERVIEIEPNNINAYNALGFIFQEVGEFKKSLAYLKKSLIIAPNNLRVVNTLLNLLKFVELSNLSESNSTELTELFIFLFKKDSIDHNSLFNNAKNLILFEETKKIAKQIIASDELLLNNNLIKKTIKNELFHLTLQKALFRDKFLEKFLCHIRKEILLLTKNKNKNENLIQEFKDFLISFAEQSFLNEYLFFQSDEEIKIINDLKNEIENDKNINELYISILGCYLPLNSSKIIIDKLVKYTSKSDLFNDLVQIQIKDAIKENELKSTINSLDNISDNISKKVREQYEENPYPRWRYADTVPKNKFLTLLNNNIKPNKIISKDNNLKRNILIAGCGTGQHLVNTSSYDNSNILAVDLSLSSLAFAKRKMQELNLSNVEFLHSDILNLKNLNKKFSVIECVGVLHHLKDPEKGLKILLDILDQKGYLKLGLYSEFARKHIVETRELIKKYNIKSNILEIRKFREIIKNDKDNKSFHKLNYNYDFYSTSNVRDLIFHVQEHRYTLPKISKFLKKYNLEFLGFTNSSNKKAYSKFYPNDLKCTSLENWNKFEINNPDIFKQMYQFWVKKND